MINVLIFVAFTTTSLGDVVVPDFTTTSLDGPFIAIKIVKMCEKLTASKRQMLFLF